MSWLMALVFASSLLCLNAGAWPFSSSDKPSTNERVVGRLGKAATAQFQEGVRRRQLRAEEITVLSRIIDEKRGEWRDLGKELKQRFAISESGTYTFNATNLTIYLVLTNGIAGSSPSRPVFRPHHAFPSQEDAEDFLRLVAARNITSAQIDTFLSVLEEKRQEHRLSEMYLDKNFGIKPEKKYRFDAETGELFEITAVPSASQAKAVRESKRKADEMAKEKARAEAEAKAAAEKKAKAEKERAEKLAAEKARQEAEAKAAAEKKAKAERERIEKLAAEKARQEAEAKAAAEKAAREKAAKDAKIAKEKAEAEKRAAELKAKLDAEARAAAEKKARIEREAAERLAAERARKEAEARAAAEKKAALTAEMSRLGIERRQVLESANQALSEAIKAKTQAVALLKEAESDYEWARRNKKANTGFLSIQKDGIAAAKKRVSAAEDAVSEAQKRVKAAEKAISRIADDAEDNVRAAMKEAARRR